MGAYSNKRNKDLPKKIETTKAEVNQLKQNKDDLQNGKKDAAGLKKQRNEIVNNLTNLSTNPEGNRKEIKEQISQFNKINDQLSGKEGIAGLNDKKGHIQKLISLLNPEKNKDEIKGLQSELKKVEVHIRMTQEKLDKATGCIQKNPNRSKNWKKLSPMLSIMMKKAMKCAATCNR